MPGANDNQLALLASQVEKLGDHLPKALRPPRRLRSILGTCFMAVSLLVNASLAITTLVYVQPFRALTGDPASPSLGSALDIGGPDASEPAPASTPVPGQDTPDGAGGAAAPSEPMPPQGVFYMLLYDPEGGTRLAPIYIDDAIDLASLPPGPEAWPGDAACIRAPVALP